MREKLAILSEERATLLELWELRRQQYEQCMDLQLFYRDTEQVDNWMSKQEAFLLNEDLGDSLDSVEALLKKHEDFEKSLSAQEEKITALDEFATKLIQNNHYAMEDVATRRDAVSSQVLYVPSFPCTDVPLRHVLQCSLSSWKSWGSNSWRFMRAFSSSC